MGFLDKLFGGHAASVLVRIAAGSFTVDPDGRIVASTLPQSFPETQAAEIGRAVVSAFHRAKDAHLPLSELVIHYSTLKITARELRGGAVVFLKPQSLDQAF